MGRRPHTSRDHTYNPTAYQSLLFRDEAWPVALPTLHNAPDEIRNTDWTVVPTRKPKTVPLGPMIEEPHLYGNRVEYSYWRRPNVIQFDVEARPRRFTPPAPRTYSDQVPSWSDLMATRAGLP